MRIEQMPSPAVAVDLDLFEQNCDIIMERARRAGVAVRPHFKTHKSMYLAEIQRAHGMDRWTAAKLSEAEMLVNGGFDNILVAFPLMGEEKWTRYAALNRLREMYTTIDSETIARGLSDACGAEHPAKVLVEIDVGTGRCGVAPENLETFVQSVRALPGLRIAGLFTYNNLMYSCDSDAKRRELAEQETAVIAQCRKTLEMLGIAVEMVSSGNTPATTVMDAYTASTEIRTGKSFFHDVKDVEAGTGDWEHCALSVLATVVSIPKPGHATIDVGSKTLTKESALRMPGNGTILNVPGLDFYNTNEEHGYVRYDPEQVTLHLGDRVRVIPNHACMLHNQLGHVYGVRGGEVVARYQVDAQGCNY